MSDVVERAAAMVAAAQRVVVLTGAGVSTGSGIPDFRGPNGLWTRNPAAERASTLSNYLGDADLRKLSWQNRLTAPLFSAQPNTCHHALVHLERRGVLHALVTQNVDGLHVAAGHDPAKVLEVHDTVHYARCWECRTRWPMAELLDRVRAGEDDPACTECGGVVKSDTILFGEQLVPEVIGGALDAAEQCDLLLAVGTSLAVGPVNGMVPRARMSGASVVIVNGQPTEMDRFAEVIVLGELAEVLPVVCGAGGNS